MSETKGRIKLVTNEHEWQLWMARQDYAVVTGQELIEKPYWYEDVETGRPFHDLYACIGWPSEVKEGDLGLPGYAAIIGIVRPHTRSEHYNPVEAKFLLLDEAQTSDVPTLLDSCVKMRERWGFGLRSDFLTVWYGDPERFITTLALKNEWLIKQGGDHNALLVTPPDDFYTPKIFDLYVRAFQSTLVRKDPADPKSVRFFFGAKDALKTRLKEFKRDDPAIMAAGGLVHSLLCRTMWMDELGKTVFNVGDV